MHHLLRPCAALAMLGFLASVPAAAQDPAAYYESNCAACHTIGGGAQGGPDLKDVTSRRSRDWLLRFLADPQKLVDTKDETALRLAKEADGAVMPTLPDLTPALAEGLLKVIDDRSGHVVTMAPDTGSSETLNPEEARKGSELFAGTRRFVNRGPACLSCHAVSGLTRLGGGSLGPDLTRVHRRLGGGRGLTSWLKAPPTPMMRATFQQTPLTVDELHALSAYLLAAETVGAEPASRSRIATLVALGTTGAAGCALLAAFVARHRLRGVRAPLVALAPAGDVPIARTPLADRQPLARPTRESGHED